MKIRVALYGNTHNNLYQMAKLLREELGVDAHLFLPKRNRIQNRPESHDPKLKDDYPDWFHVGAYNSPLAQYLPMFSPLIKDVEGFDYIVLSQKGPTLAPYLRPKTLFYVTGTDLTRTPFYGRCWRWYKSFPAKLLSLVRTFWQRRGLRHVDEIWGQPYGPLIDAIQDLGLSAYNRKKYFPLILEQISPSCQGIESLVSELQRDWDFLVFNPSQLLIEDSPDMVATGAWKNNLVLLYGFARFVKQKGAKRAALMVVERRNNQREQTARKRFRQVAQELGISDNLIFLPPPESQDVFTRAQVHCLYEISDVIGDDFGVGGIGSIDIEALSMAKPLVSNVGEEFMQEVYGDHPVIDVREPEEIALALVELYSNPDYRLKVGQEGLAWYQKHHSPQGAKHRYLKNLEFLKSADNELESY